MNNKTKKCIRRVAEKYNHFIEYDKDVLILKNEINVIRLWQSDKYCIHLSYNSIGEVLIENKLKREDLFNFLIEILKRSTLDSEIMLGTGNLLTIQEWINEEGQYVDKMLHDFKKEIEESNIVYKDFGGNRIFAEYFKGVIILIDDFCWGKSNVILLKE